MGISLFINCDGSPFLKIGIILAILSLSVNMPVFINWFINMVNYLMISVSIIFNSFEEIPSQPQLRFVVRLYIVLCTVSLLTFLNLKKVNVFFFVMAMILIAIILNPLCNSLTYACIYVGYMGCACMWLHHNKLCAYCVFLPVFNEDIVAQFYTLFYESVRTILDYAVLPSVLCF